MVEGRRQELHLKMAILVFDELMMSGKKPSSQSRYLNSGMRLATLCKPD